MTVKHFLVLAILVGALILFVTEKVRADVVALLVMLALIALELSCRCFGHFRRVPPFGLLQCAMLRISSVRKMLSGTERLTLWATRLIWYFSCNKKSPRIKG